MKFKYLPTIIKSVKQKNFLYRRKESEIDSIYT